METILTNKGAIYFPKNKDNINFTFGLNKTDGAKADWSSLYNYIKQSYKVKDISINGWASPEGEETFNDNLSGKRAEAAKKEILKDFEKMRKDKKNPFNVPADITFSTAGNGPDWNGFMKQVEASDLKEKSTVMNVVNSADPKKKEEEIRNMILIYPQIEEKLLPPLRRAEVVVSVFEPKKTAEEIAALAVSKPESLTDKELLYAATLTEDIKTQQKIYRAAAQLYPDNYRAHNNAGVTELKLGNTNEAASYFEKANSLSPDNGEVVNNMGAVAMKKGDYAKARQLFEKAKKLGMNENYNLGVLFIPEGKYEEALAGMKGKKCDYNLALALILSGNTADAGKQLDCATKDGNTYYLSAILAARTNNAAMVYENLGNAVKADANLKATAKNDREFIKFFETAEFKKIVE
jgi:Flp pilus assembly protein TadD